jgi:hypothetical protein
MKYKIPYQPFYIHDNTLKTKYRNWAILLIFSLTYADPNPPKSLHFQVFQVFISPKSEILLVKKTLVWALFS